VQEAIIVAGGVVEGWHLLVPFAVVVLVGLVVLVVVGVRAFGRRSSRDRLSR
jgi:hypothetical protein